MPENYPLLEVALNEARRRYAERRPNTARLHETAARVMPGGNTRTVLYHRPFPLRIEGGAGATVRDADGNTYVDLLGEYTAGLFGHSEPRIVAELHRTIDDGISLGAHNIYEGQFAELVTCRFPTIERVRFTNSGTEANLMAVALARHVTGRDCVMVFRGGYHGGVLLFSGEGSPLNAPYQYLVATYNDVEGTRAAIRRFGASVACVLVEPMLGSGGCVPGDLAFLDMLREETRQVGSLLILDEVMTSRFGPSGAGALLGVDADLMTLGKWVGGGMSFGAFGGRADLIDRFDPARAGSLAHAGTFNNNSLTMRAGIVALRDVFTSAVAVAHHARGDVLRNALNAMFARRGAALHASGVGSLMNIHGFAGPAETIADLDASVDGRKELLFLELIARGYYIARRGFIALSLAVTANEEAGFLAALDDILTAQSEALR